MAVGTRIGRSALLRLPPMVATAAVLVTSLVFSLWWNLHVDHNHVWYEPADLWRTMLAAVRLDHGQLSQLYTNGTNLVSFPGAAVVLAPAAAVISALHYPLAPPIGTYTDTDAWLVALPYTVLVSSSVLFAADAVARRMGATTGKRLVLALAGGVAMWNVVPYWGHPEDCVAVAFLLYGVDQAAAGRRWWSAWLVGLGLAVQPLVLLAVPVLAVVVGGRHIVGWLVRAAIPPGVAVGAALAANWSATWYQIVDQPNWPLIDRPTPWIHLAPHLTSQTVAAGPGRSIALVLAVLAAWPAWAAWRRAERRAASATTHDASPVVPPDTLAAAVHAARPAATGGRVTPVSAGWLTAPDGSQRWAVDVGDLDPTGPDPWPAHVRGPLLATDPMGTDAGPVAGDLPATAAGRTARAAVPWSAEGLVTIVWWVALTLALRCGFESVMVSYYIWSGIAVGLLASATSWWRVVPAGTLGIGLTCFCNVWWHGEWSWWSVIVVGLALLLTAAHPAIEGGTPTVARPATGPDPEFDQPVTPVVAGPATT